MFRALASLMFLAVMGAAALTAVGLALRYLLWVAGVT